METHYLVVNSNLRDTTLYPSGNSYTMHLTNPIHDVTRVELIQASVPNVIQNLPDGTNAISLDGSTFSLPNGFYSANGLAAEVQNAIEPVTNVSVTYLSNEGKYLFSRPTTDPNGNFTLTLSSTLATLMGFTSTSAGTSAPVANDTPPTTFALYANNDRYQTTTFLKSDQLVNLTADNYIYLDVAELNTSRMQQAQKIETNSFSTSASQNNFGPIVLDVSSGAIKHFSETSDYIYAVDYYPPISQLSRVTVRWRKTDGTPINFQGLNENSFMLKVTSKFRKDDVAPNLRQKASKPRPIVLVPKQT
jgi:hypothetical protein